MDAISWEELDGLDLGALLRLAETAEGSLYVYEHGRVLYTPDGPQYEAGDAELS
jgi:hypothetical protein